MCKDTVVTFLTALGCVNIQSSVGSPWVSASCPLAPWFHKDKTDKRAVFAIRASSKKIPYPEYHCHECGIKGLLPRLLENLKFVSKKDYENASRVLQEFNLSGDGQVRGRRRIIVSKDKLDAIRAIKTNEVLHVPHEVLKRYPLVAEVNSQASKEIQAWLWESYQVPLQLIAQYGLRIFVEVHSRSPGIVFPVFYRQGEKVMDLWVRMIESGRSFRLDPHRTGSKVDYRGTGFWFGNQFWDEDKPLVLVSGPLDVLRLRALGIRNVWACMGKNPTPEQLYSVRARMLYIAFDSDLAGKESAKNAAETLKARSKFLLNWGWVGIKGPRHLATLKQFKQVFDKRIKLIKESTAKTTGKDSPPNNRDSRQDIDPFDI